MNWRPGDALVVRPENSNEQIDELFDIFQEHGFNFDPDTIVQLSEIDMGKIIYIKKQKQFDFRIIFYFHSCKHLFLN